MLEVALVFDTQGNTLHWQDGSSGVYIPDSHDLWTILWENRDTLGGVAHTHPWSGDAWPSQEDVTTWNAVERGLGKRLVWPIVTFTAVRYFVWCAEKNRYIGGDQIPIEIDIEGLRARSSRPGIV